jgi:hypothetical protein
MNDRDELLNLLTDHLYSLEAAIVGITNLLIERGHLDRRETAGHLRYLEQVGRTAAAQLDQRHYDRSDLIRIAEDIETGGSPQVDPRKPGS